MVTSGMARVVVAVATVFAGRGLAQQDPPPFMCFDAELADGEYYSYPTLGTTTGDCDYFNGNDARLGSHWVPSPCWWPRLGQRVGCLGFLDGCPPNAGGTWDDAWNWLQCTQNMGAYGGFPLNVDLNLGVGQPGLPPLSYDPGAGTSPLVPPGGGRGDGQVRWPRTTVGATVDAITGTPVLREVDLELPFGSAVFRHLRTYGQYHELRHEMMRAGDAYDHIVRRTIPGGDFWESTGNGWTMTSSPLLLIDVGYQVLAGVPAGPRRCIFMPDAHHAISFIQDTSSGVYVAPPHFGAQLSHNGEWVEDTDEPNGGYWGVRPTAFRVWLYDGSVCYTIRALYEDVFPGFLPDEDDRAEGMYSDNDPVDSLGACYNSLPYWGLCERIDDRYGNCIDIEYCEFRAENWGSDPECQACTVNYNEKGQVERIRLISGVSFNTAGDWNDWVKNPEWDPENLDNHPFDWVDGGPDDSVDWTLLFTYRSFWAEWPFNVPQPDQDEDTRYPLSYARENAIHSVHVYEGEREAQGSPCRTIDFTEFYNPLGDGSGQGEGGGWWKAYDGTIADLDPIDSLELPGLDADWSYRIGYLYAEPHRRDNDAATDPYTEDEFAWYDAAYGDSCRFAGGAPRLLKTTVTTRDFAVQPPEESEEYRLYRYDSYGDWEGYVFNDQQTTVLQHVYDHGTIAAALKHLNAAAPSNPWTVNHLIGGVGPGGEDLGAQQFPVLSVDGDAEDTDATWAELASISMYAWDGFVHDLFGGGTAARDNGVTGDWQEFQDDTHFAAVLAGGGFAALSQQQSIFMQPGVALLAERGLGGGQRYFRLYRFYVSHQSDPFTGLVGGAGFVEWSPNRSPLRSVLHEPCRMPDYDGGMEWATGSEPQPRGLDEDVWIVVIDEYESFEAATVDDWANAELPRMRRAVYMNAAGFVRMDRSWEFTEDGVLMNTEGYTETYGYDSHGRMTHIYSTGYNTLADPDNTSRGLITRLAYWPAEERDGVGSVRGPIDIPFEVRARGVQRGDGGVGSSTEYWSELTERYSENGEIVRFDLVTELYRFDPPITDLDNPPPTAEVTEIAYEFVRDADGDGTDDEPKDWVITEKTTLGPEVALDDTADRYRARESLYFDEVDDEVNGLQRGRLRWRVYGMEPVGAGPRGTRLLDYTHYDSQGRVVRLVTDAGEGAILGSLYDFNDDDTEPVDDYAGVSVVYPAGVQRLYPGSLGGPANRVTKTLFGDRGPRIIEHSGGEVQTQFSYRTVDDVLEVRKVRGLTRETVLDQYGQPIEVSVPHGPGQVSRVARGAPEKVMHVVWDDWQHGDRIWSQSYVVIAETETGKDASGRANSATQRDWRGNERTVRANLDRFGTMSRREEAEGTISRTLGDGRGRPVRLYVGTADGHEFWNNGQSTGPDNLVLTEQRGYGEGATDAGLQTFSRQFRERSPNLYEDFTFDFSGEGWLQETRYDWRMRPVWQVIRREGDDSDALRHTITLYDNLDRVRFVAEYGETAPEPDANSDNTITFGQALYDGRFEMPAAADILGTSPLLLTETEYNAGGQVERVIEYDPEALSDQAYLATRTYFDRKNNETLRQQPSTAATVSEYDSEGRVTTRRVVVDAFASTLDEITRTEYEYDADGRAILVRTLERTHDGASGPLDQANAVETQEWSWYDHNGRLQASASLGAGGDTQGDQNRYVNDHSFPDRGSFGDPPTLSAGGAVDRVGLPGWITLSCYRYDAAGRQSAVATQLTHDASPAYRVDRSYYDGMGNLRYLVENHGAPASEVRRTAYRYDAATGQLTHIAAVLPGHSQVIEFIGPDDSVQATDPANYLEPDWDADDGTLQVTALEYDAEVYAGAGEPPSQNNGWVGAMHLPDPLTGQPSAAPALTFTYYADGLVRSRTDAAGRTFTHFYDQFGRRTKTLVEYAWPDPDPYEAYRPFDLSDLFVFQYDERDQLVRATAAIDVNADGELDAGDTIVADNTFEYSARGDLVEEQQSYGDLASDDPLETVGYTWEYESAAGGGGNLRRLAGIEYPQNHQTSVRRSVAVGYDSDPYSDVLSRISRLFDETADVEAVFDFAGSGRRVGSTTRRDVSGTPAVVWSQSYGELATVGYPGLDRRGRVKDLRFRDGTGGDLHRYRYTYNAAGDRLSALVDQVGESNTRSWFYGYDALSRLVSAERGSLLADQSGIDYGAAVVPERVSWGLDTLGNWTEPAGEGGAFAGRVEEQWDTGGSDYGILLGEQTHSTDLKNRLNAVTTNDGVDPPAVEIYVHDAVGNLVADDMYWYQYDAFNHLASVHEKGSLSFNGDGTAAGGSPGAWRLYLTYDAVGRLISTQKPWGTQGTDHRKAWLYYDGVRRIVEVFKDPVAGPAGPIGGGQGGGYVTYTDREYVWGPDYVDECLWQVTRPGEVLHVLQDASVDVIAVLSQAGIVARQYLYAPYGQLLIADDLNPAANNRLGYHGLFFSRLDDNLPSLTLSIDTRGVYYNRNRTFIAGSGRFLSHDSHGTCAFTLPLFMQGRSVPLDSSAFSMQALFDDGLNAYGYLRSQPAIRQDPSGLVSLLSSMLNIAIDGIVEAAYGHVGDKASERLYELFLTHSINQQFAFEDALDWSVPDDSFGAYTSLSGNSVAFPDPRGDPKQALGRRTRVLPGWDARRIGNLARVHKGYTAVHERLTRRMVNRLASKIQAKRVWRDQALRNPKSGRSLSFGGKRLRPDVWGFNEQNSTFYLREIAISEPVAHAINKLSIMKTQLRRMGYRVHAQVIDARGVVHSVP